MSYSVVFLEKAISEMNDSYQWYELQQQGLGEKFLIEIEEYKNIIRKHPELYKINYKKFREIWMKIFPFLIVYYISKTNQEIVIISVFHSSRNPKKKYKNKS
jgi:hypothetical protein